MGITWTDDKNAWDPTTTPGSSPLCEMFYHDSTQEVATPVENAVTRTAYKEYNCYAYQPATPTMVRVVDRVAISFVIVCCCVFCLFSL